MLKNLLIPVIDWALRIAGAVGLVVSAYVLARMWFV